jgi:hypothetical protein
MDGNASNRSRRATIVKGAFLKFVPKSIHCYCTGLQLPKTSLLHLKLIKATITLALLA